MIKIRLLVYESDTEEQMLRHMGQAKPDGVIVGRDKVTITILTLPPELLGVAKLILSKTDNHVNAG